VPGPGPPAVLVISVICIPYLTKAAETSLDQVPNVQQYLACDAVLLLFVLVLIAIILGRVAVAISRRYAE